MRKIHHVRLYTGERIFENGVVLVDGQRIAYAGDAADAPSADGAELLDGRGGILCPGFYNAHCHAAMTLERGVGSDLNLMDWLHQIFPIEDRLTGEYVYWATQLAFLEMLRRGTVGVADTYFFMEQVGRAALETGIRANISRSCTTVEGVDSVKSLHRDFDGAGDGRVRVFMGVHGEYTTEPNMVRYAIETARELDTGVHFHLSETRAEVEGCTARHGVRPTIYFDQLGMFDGPTIAAHCVHVDDEEIAVLARGGACAVHNPASNMKLASGFARVGDMLKAGVSVALGTDGPASNNTLDMLSDMRLASLLQKDHTGDPTALNAAQAFHMATRAGATGLGFADCGLIKTGMQADMILLDGEAETMTPCPDVLAAIVYAAQGLNVKMTMVQGNILYQDGVFTTLDKEKILRHVDEAARKMGII